MLDVFNMKHEVFEINVEPFVLKYLVRDTAALFDEIINNMGLELQVIMTEQVPYKVITDKLRLQQIIINLVKNAIKHTTQGTIHIFCNFYPDKRLLDVSV